MKLVAVTASHTDAAHAYLAAEKLFASAQQCGHQLKVETQTLSGIDNELTLADISHADIAVFACDVAIENESRFAQIPILKTVHQALEAPEYVLKKLHT